MKPNDNDRTVQSCDLFLPGSGESLGGAVRIHDADVLSERLARSRMFKVLQERGIGREQFNDYLSHMVKYGKEIGQHFGFGVGVDRVVQFYMGCNDIRECAGFLVQ